TPNTYPNTPPYTPPHPQPNTHPFFIGAVKTIKMSGIVGIYRLNGRPVDRREVWDMVETMPYRSKDGKDVWADGPVGLGHLMLHTTPESLHEHLPATNSDGSLVITADARIDNRDELIGLLRLNGRGASATDSDLILLAYEKWGESCVDHFLGDYVFAIWDRRTQKLVCARDHLGVRPFYYYYKPGELFAFGSESKSLLTFDEVPNRLNEVRIADYLAVMHEDKEITELEEILRLPPAHTLSIDRKSTRLNSSHVKIS